MGILGTDRREIMKEFTKGAPDYDALQELYTYIKRWRSVEWTEQNREMASASRLGIYDRLSKVNKEEAELFFKMAEGYDYGRDKVDNGEI